MEFHNMLTAFFSVRSTGDLAWLQAMRKVSFMISSKVESPPTTVFLNY